MENKGGRPKQISPRMSVMKGMQGQKVKDLQRRSSAFTLEYRQLRTEADEHFLKVFLLKVKKILGRGKAPQQDRARGGGGGHPRPKA